LARALAKGGLPAIEITLRTAAALDAIRAVANEVPEAIVGAGTILNARQYDEAVNAGSRFIVSPGATPQLIAAARDSKVPLLPGAITPGEIMSLREEGYTMLKFFPAEQAGGAAFLKSLSSPLAGTLFCPTGGVSIANAKTYLNLPNVVCVGGSWVAPEELVKAGKWDEITKLAAEAVKFAG
jgi:2-dehydro-3-deoxyphosphogluconate aldolase / (4S)-4-hydroxy-2-oxoglutarate aldolase